MATNLTALFGRQISECRSNGMLDLFGRALAKTNGQSGQNVYQQFARFLQTAETFSVTRGVLTRFKQEFGGHITFWQAMDIVMITRRKKIHHFLPLSELNEYSQISGASVDVFKSRFGAYIPNGGTFFHAGLHSQMRTRGAKVPEGHLIRKSPSS